MAAKIRKGDMVLVISGKDRGKSGRVLRVVDRGQRVIVEKLNMVQRHQRPTQKFPQGGIVEKEAPIHISNVMLLDGKNRPVRVGFRVLEDGRKIRIARQTGEPV